MPSPDCALHPDLKAGLAADLSAWPLRSITPNVLEAAQRGDHRLRESDITAAFGIFNNTLHWLRPDAHPRPRNPQLYAIADDLRALLGLYRVPDVEFLLNVDDYPKSQRMVPTEASGRRVPAPLFSFTKRERRDAASGRVTTSDYDVLVPSGAFRMSYLDAKMLARSPAQWEASLPWARKRPKAYFRGTPYCGIHRFGRCSRYVLPRLAHEGRAPALDVGLVEYEAAHDTERRDHPEYTPLAKAAREPEANAALHKWVIHLDGHSFSSRLQHLLLSNSAVLKQESDYVEYYYRALRPWQHYIPFYVSAADDIVEVLANVSEHDEEVHEVARRGQAFAHTQLDVDSRFCYWRKLLHAWRKRFAYAPTRAAWPASRPRDGHYTCGECRRPPNPELIGPWPAGHACNVVGGPRRAGAGALAAGLAGAEAQTTVRECRRRRERGRGGEQRGT